LVFGYIFHKIQSRRQVNEPLLPEVRIQDAQSALQGGSENNDQYRRGSNMRNAAEAAERRAQANAQNARNPYTDMETDLKRRNHRYTLHAQPQQAGLLAEECTICCEPLGGGEEIKLYKTPCGHIFHAKCLKEWSTKKLNCPCCRETLYQFTK